ncbi:uncharacterized protein DFL_007226 [Arthrobotrys flagrans]|uniref:Uncharacterized protein n=1 Tax=Arthrobotrys flagrans TaxID=97331 RepID=A0A436ZVN8_ARTFL|nr:hypothetical protein DFL_007226 [Arthrobotrys flagrans]
MSQRLVCFSSAQGAAIAAESWQTLFDPFNTTILVHTGFDFNPSILLCDEKPDRQWREAGLQWMQSQDGNVKQASRNASAGLLYLTQYP